MEIRGGESIDIDPMPASFANDPVAMPVVVLD